MRFPVKSKVIKIAAAVLFIVAVLGACSLGCGKTEAEEKITFPTALSELSLVQIWEKVVEVTDVQDSTADLRSFSLQGRENEMGEISFLYFEFHGMNTEGKSQSYRIDLNGTKGELIRHSYDLDEVYMSASPNHPLEYFEELDKVGLANMETNAHFWISIDFQWGDLGWVRDDIYTDIYRLNDGELTSLNKIIFHTDTPVGHIEVANGGARQTWFITSDIDKAATVEYLEAQ